MGKLIILIMILIIKIQCKSYQKGSWSKQQYINSSFLFNFLQGQTGYAYFTITSPSQYLGVQLWDEENGKSSISMDIWMETSKFMTDASFHMYQKHLKCSFKNEDTPITYGEQELNINRKLSFNITYIPRKILQLKSVQGTFTINTIDLEQISPYIYEKIWLLLVIIPVIFTITITPFSRKTIFKNQDEALGINSMVLLWALAFRYTYSLWDQTYYLSDTSGVSFLSFVAFLVWLIEIVIICVYLSACNNNVKGSKSSISPYFFIGAHISGIIIMARIFFEFLSVIKLWFLLLPFVLYQVWKLLTLKIKKGQQLVLLLFALMYSLPAFICPLFAIQLNYPQSEAQLWWVYLSFFFIEASSYYLRMHGGLKFKVKRFIFSIRRCFSSQQYLTLQESLCPICFKEVQASEVNMAAAGESQQADWLKAPCNHYFHRECLVSNMEYIDGCYFDGTQWPKEFTQLIPYK